MAARNAAKFSVLLGLSPLWGCAHPPKFVRTSRYLRFLYRPATMPYLDDPRFSFEMPTKWVGPEGAPGGVRYREPHGRAAITIGYFGEGEPGWKPPEAYRQFMREQGTVEDSHILSKIEISSRSADTARFMGYVYGQEYLLGQKVEVEQTELIMAPDPHGIFVIAYESTRRDFPRFRRVLEAFLKSLVLASPKLPEENGVE